MTTRRVVAWMLVCAGVLVLASLLAYAFPDALYRPLARGAARLPMSWHDPIAVASERGPLLLVAITAVIALIAWRRGGEPLLRFLTAAVGSVMAYASSELIKLLATERRPCQGNVIETVVTCPSLGDWSWPSNHATIAAALATTCILTIPRSWPLLIPAALLVAFARVVGGVHYVHDVTSGMLLGMLITAAVSLALARLVTRLRRNGQHVA